MSSRPDSFLYFFILQCSKQTATIRCILLYSHATMTTLSVPFFGTKTQVDHAKQFLLEKLQDRYRVEQLFNDIQERKDQHITDEDMVDEKLLVSIRKQACQERKQSL